MKTILLFVCLAIGGIAVETLGARTKRAGGGRAITIEMAPYFASLRQHMIHVCGGAFVSTRHVLTAAQCVLNEAFEYLYDTTVVSGTDRYNRLDFGQPIKNISAHEDFLGGNLSCDIAVITLSAHVEWNIKLSRIALPIADPLYGKSAMMTTFQFKKSVRSNPGLQELGIKIFPFAPNADIPDHVIRGTTAKHERLSGPDCGAPLVYKRRIIGIASWMFPKSVHGCYFVNVFKYKTFIENAIADETFPNLKHSSGLPWPAKRQRH